MKREIKDKNGIVYKTMKDYYNSTYLRLNDIWFYLVINKRTPQNGQEEKWLEDINRALKKNYPLPVPK